MREAHFLYPQYGWNKNKGYGTAFHREAIKNSAYVICTERVLISPKMLQQGKTDFYFKC
jgi:ribonuclease HII